MLNSKTARQARDAEAVLENSADSAERRGHILFADDDLMVVRATSAALSAAGFEVTTVTSAALAQAALQVQPADAVLLDIDMPGNQNLELLHTLSNEQPLVPVVILTGRPTVDTAVRAVRLGVVDYIAKPPQMDELIGRLDLAVHRGRVLKSIEAAENFAAELTRRLEALKRVIRQGPGASVVAPAPGGAASDALRNLSEQELKRLSRRERDVLRELAKGHSPQQMASTLKLATNTIRNHLKSIFVKLGVKSQVALLGKLATPGR